MGCLQIANAGYVPGPSGLYRWDPNQMQRNRSAMTNGHMYFAKKHFANDAKRLRACLATMHAQEVKAARAARAWGTVIRHLTALLWNAGGFRQAMQVWSLVE